MANYTYTDALRLRLNIYAAVSFLLLLVCGALTLALPLRERGQNVAQQLLTTTVVSHGQAVEAWMRHAQAVAWHVALRPGVRGLLPPARPEPTKAEAMLAASMGTTGDTAALALMTVEGQQVAACGIPLPPQLVSKAMPPHTAAGSVYVSPPTSWEGQEYILLAVPVLDAHIAAPSHTDKAAPSERVLGKILLLRNLSYLHKIFNKDTKYIPTARYFLRMHDDVLFGQKPEDATLIANATGTKAFALATEGKRGILFHGDMAYAYAQVPYWRWELVGTIPVSQLYATSNTGFWYIIWATLMVYALCFVGFYLLSRPLAGRILLHTQELEQDISARHLAQQQLEKAHTLLQDSYAQYRELSGQLIEKLEEMRQKLATELHDNTGQQLTTLLLGLEVAQRHAAQGQVSAQQMCAVLQEAAAQVQHIQKEIRRTSHGLYPPALGLVGLARSMEHLCHDFCHNGLMVHCTVSPLPDLDDSVALALYRIAQEALTNIVRHSKASEVHVALSRQDAQVVLTVEDNGQGFVQKITNAGPAHLGLRLMHERAQHCGGSVTVESAPGQGTLILVEIPLGASDI